MPALFALDRLWDALLPPLCLHCGAALPTARPALCRDCRATLRPLAPGCRRCALPRPGRPDSCARCRDWPPELRALAGTRYGGPAESTVRALKYRGWSHLAELAAEAMARAIAGVEPTPDVLVPVPLHPARRRERGFNQAELLAHALSHRCGSPVADSLSRLRPTRSQVGLGRAARAANVRDAFTLHAPLRPGARVGLVDDVATSGATLRAAAGRLLEGGAGDVIGITFALAQPGPPG